MNTTTHDRFWKGWVFFSLFFLVMACDSDGGDETSHSDGGDAHGMSDVGEGAQCEALRPTLEDASLRVEGTLVLDALDREVLLRGINAGGRSKLPPFLPFDYAESPEPIYDGAPTFDEAVELYVDRVHSWGHNVVRVPFTWEAVEPERDAFDEDWLSAYESLVNAFSERDIYVIVDYHQDVYSRVFCGDGFPLWTLEDPTLEIPPPEDCHQWFMGYITDGPSRDAFDRFWANEDGLRDELADMWRHMVGRFSSNPMVVGFEIMNEPGWGNADRAEFSKNVLTPFYSEMIEVVREVAPEAVVFFDSTGLDAVEAATSLERPEGEGIFFAPHYYDPPAILQGVWNGTADYTEPVGKWRIQGDAWEVPVLVGEFGLRREAVGADDYVRLNYEALDAHLLHGTSWEYSESAVDWNDEGMSVYSPMDGESDVALATMRAYPAAVAGTATSFSFDHETLNGVLVYEATGAGTTEIAVPSRLFPDGVSATVEGATGCVAHDGQAQRLVVQVMEAGTVTVEFGPMEEGVSDE